MTRLEYQQIYDVVGAAMEVHKILGRGMEEAIYQEALQMELVERGISVEREKRLRLTYKEKTLKKTYLADFFCNGMKIDLSALEISEGSETILLTLRDWLAMSSN